MVIFGVDNSNSKHTENENSGFIVSGKRSSKIGGMNGEPEF